MDEREEDIQDSHEGRGGRFGGKRSRRGRGSGFWRDPYKLGILLQLCLIVLLLSLLIYSLFPFFAAAERLNLSMRHVFYLPVAVLVVVIFFARRIVRLVRKLRDEEESEEAS